MPTCLSLQSTTRGPLSDSLSRKALREYVVLHVCSNLLLIKVSVPQLGLTFVDLYLAHYPERVNKHGWKEFEKIKQDGLARYGSPFLDSAQQSTKPILPLYVEALVSATTIFSNSKLS